MVLLKLRGVEVEFPYEPYPCQIEYMTKNIEALQTGENALLESPTGTGKTLCLLCSTLAYQKHIKLKNESQLLYEEALDPMKFSTGKLNKLEENIVILYASRTHSQLAQVAKELKSTSYRPNLCVLGSRDQLCVHEKYSKFKGSKLNNLCNIATKEHKCDKKNNLDKFNRSIFGSFAAHPVSSEIMDIEDMVNNIGKTKNMCPYFYSRDFIKNAELVLLPYNYLLDISIRRTMDSNYVEGGSGIKFSRSVIIFDEAHNLERVACDSSSVTFTTTDVAECIKELQNTLQLLKSGKHANIYDRLTADGKKRKKLPEQDTVILLLKAFFDLESRIDQIPLAKGLGNTPSCVMPGDWMADVFELCGFTYQNMAIMLTSLNSCSDFIMEIQAQTLGAEAAAVNLAIPKMSFFMESLTRIFRYANKVRNKATLSEHYKVFVCCEENKYQKSHNSSNNTDKNKRVINFWCFSPGLAMEEFKEMAVKTIILTSGTLSPMDSFKEDMRIKFAIQLENPHVISNSQVFVGALGVGTNGNKLNSSYAVRDTIEYKDELGVTILHLIETMQGKGICSNSLVSASINDYQSNNVVASLKGPDIKGGVLVFFPSYTIMDSMISRWKEVGNPSLYERLKLIAGNIIVEPRARSEVKNTTNFRDNKSSDGKYGGKNIDDKVPVIIDDISTEEKELMLSLVKTFESALSANGRCLLLAVCRGKVSEGIDFKDERGRLVIITGIPYAPHLDPWIVLKRENLDQKIQKWKQKNNGSSTTSSTVSSQGNLSYQQLLKESSIDNTAKSSQPAASLPAGVIPPYIPFNQLSQSNNNTVAKVTTNSTIISDKKLNVAPIQPNNSGLVAPSLDGQAWYNQAASRAVNQAIGRVIRHKHDWGAIFLLDDRFLYEKQMKELSKWLRSRVVKFPSNSKASLIDFRNFITAAHNDPMLQPACNNKANSSNNNNNSSSASSSSSYSAPAPYSMKAANSNNVFSKEIVIDANALKSDDNSEGLTFIDPSLLLSQAPSETNNLKSNSSITVSNNRNAMSVDSVHSSISISKPRVNEPAIPVKFSSIFGQPTSKTINAGTKVISSVNNTVFQAKSFELPVAKKENDDNIILGPLLKGLIGEMKSKLNVELFGVFKDIMRDLNQEQEIIFQEELKMQEFIEKLLHLFSLAKLPSNTSKQWLMRLSNLVPKDNDKDKIYRQLVTSVIAAANAAAQPAKRPLDSAIKLESDVKIPRTVENTSRSTETSKVEKPIKPVVIISDTTTESTSNIPTKRTFTVINKAPTTTVNNVKLPDSSSQENVYSQPYSQRTSDRGSRNMIAMSQSKSISDKKLFASCPICMESPKDPCAGKCGHIFCSICMNGWLHKKQECPVCKRPTTFKDVAKIKIK